jgi:hypothetical protein
MLVLDPSARRKRTVPWWRSAGPLAVGLLVVAASLAACGGSPSKGPAQASSAALRYASCMRSNGVTNYPDPGNNGRPQSLKHINSDSPTFQTAYKACQKYAPNGEGGPPAPSAAELHTALAFSQCMRAHGFPQFPDPLTAVPDQPNLTLGQGLYFPLNSTTDFQSPSPAFAKAAKACGFQLP